MSVWKLCPFPRKNVSHFTLSDFDPTTQYKGRETNITRDNNDNTHTHIQSQLTWQYMSVWYATACASPIWLSYQITTFAMHYNYKTSFLHGVPLHLPATRNIQHTRDAPICFGNSSFGDPILICARLATSFLCAHSFFLIRQHLLSVKWIKAASTYMHYNNTPIQWFSSFTFFRNLMTSNCTLLFVSFLFMPLNLNAMVTNNTQNISQFLFSRDESGAGRLFLLLGWISEMSVHM